MDKEIHGYLRYNIIPKQLMSVVSVIKKIDFEGF
jgi:hypothetical protein